MAKGQLLLLTGSPGSGKTTVAPLVADLAPLSACLDLDWFFAKLRSGAMEPWLTEAHRQNRVVLSAAASAVATFTAGGYFTVAEGILYPFMLDLFADACRPLGIDINYAILRAPLPVVLSRVQRRTVEPEHFGALADEQVIDDLWSQFEAQGVDLRHLVNAGERGPEAIAAELYEGCVQGRYIL
ncbi:MAG TPA: AAA family ATPase [Acidimicrobiales bacterium]|nr:AAA family ATPase [Acidimicrobiales bacterium]